MGWSDTGLKIVGKAFWGFIGNLFLIYSFSVGRWHQPVVRNDIIPLQTALHFTSVLQADDWLWYVYNGRPNKVLDFPACIKIHVVFDAFASHYFQSAKTKKEKYANFLSSRAVSALLTAALLRFFIAGGGPVTQYADDRCLRTLELMSDCCKKM